MKKSNQMVLLNSMLLFATASLCAVPAHASDISVTHESYLASGIGTCLKASGSLVVSGACPLEESWRRSGDRIVHKSSGKCIDLGSQDSKPVLAACNDEKSQKWLVDVYGLKNVKNGNCLDIARSDTTEGAKVITWGCSGAANQAWQAFKEVSRTVFAENYYAKKKPVILPNIYARQSVHIDCLVSGADDEETGNRITVTWFDSNDKKVGRLYRDGISTCHGANDKWTLERAEEAAYVIVSTNGDDGYLMDQVLMYREGKAVRTHGKNDSRGWCLSTDNTDHNKGNFNGHSVDSQCPKQRRFSY